MKRKKDTVTQLIKQPVLSETMQEPETDICSCPPISPLCLSSTTEQTIHSNNVQCNWDDEDDDPILPTSFALNNALRTHLHTLFSRTTPLSIMLVHVSQLEHMQITPETVVWHKRRRYHPPASIVEQVMVNVRRAIRADDVVCLDTGKGAAIILPDADQQGAYKVLERVYNSVNLLQAETIIPPLTHQTNIVLGIGSYPEQGPSLEHVLASAGRIIRRFTLRPAITMHLWDTMPVSEHTTALHATLDDSVQDDQDFQHNYNSTSLPISAHMYSDDTRIPATITPLPHEAARVPFLQLPAVLPAHLKSLLPYKIASQFRCVPMGRNHQRLTLAMADPTNAEAIHALHKITGMMIFPVSCDHDALDTLLNVRW